MGRRPLTAAGLAACVAAASPSLAAAAPRVPDVVRVGGPSRPSDAKVAIVAGGDARPGRPFTVRSTSGRVVLRGRLRRVPGSPAPWGRAAAADLTRVRAPGRYRVVVGRLRSRPWVVDDGAARATLARLLRLFAVQADGREANPVFKPAHLNDAVVAGGAHDGEHVDLTGGWRDAGDMLKFAQTTAVAVSYLSLAARLDPADAPALHRTADVGVRWLLKAHPAPDLFVEEVGDARDHDSGFRDPASDDANPAPGVGQRVAYPTAGSAVPGKVAGALALTAARATGDLRAALLTAAAQWYAHGVQLGRLQRIDSPFVEDFYPEETYTDDLAFGAAELWRATGEQHYLDEAMTWLARGRDDQFYAGVVAGEPAPLTVADLCGGLGLPAAPGAAGTQACGRLRLPYAAALDRSHERAFGSPGIVTFGWVADHAGAGVIAAASARAGVAPAGRALAAGARDHLLGRNQWGRSFLVGRASWEAKNPHHPAYLVGSPATLLDGAVVGGTAMRRDLATQNPPLRLAATPERRFDSDVVYEDVRSDYVTSEVGLVYQASAVLLLASLA